MTSAGNVFIGNFAFRLGGGADVDDAISVRDQFRGNWTGPQGSGGGMFAAGVLDLDSGLFYTNTANTAGGLGVNSTGSGEVYNSLFVRNVVTFTDGGTAMRLLSTSSVLLAHNTIVGASQASRAAIHMQSTGVFTFYNNIFANHAQGLKNFNPPPPTGTVPAENNNIFFNVSTLFIGQVTTGSQSLITNPLFVNPANDDYHLGGGSPAIDAALPLGINTDFDGQPRGQPAGWDIGFDEAWHVDLGLTKSSGQASVAAGAPLTYTIVVTNAGPQPVQGTVLSDSLPAGLTDAAWTCQAMPGSSCPASGSGNILAALNLAVGGRVTVTVQATVSPSASGSLVNTATVAAPVNTFDLVSSNNSATDTTAIIASVRRLFLPLIVR
jgi:uncharacterized repeat protein (TIGR01451 family)